MKLVHPICAYHRLTRNRRINEFSLFCNWNICDLSLSPNAWSRFFWPQISRQKTSLPALIKSCAISFYFQAMKTWNEEWRVKNIENSLGPFDCSGAFWLLKNQTPSSLTACQRWLCSEAQDFSIACWASAHLKSASAKKKMGLITFAAGENNKTVFSFHRPLNMRLRASSSLQTRQAS